jgi:hypothetical protein
MVRKRYEGLLYFLELAEQMKSFPIALLKLLKLGSFNGKNART